MDTTWALAGIATIVLGFPFIFTVEVGICDLIADEGPCNKSVHRYYYDNEQGTCNRFLYGGCKGNANRFSTLKNCEEACKPARICGLPKIIGPCKAIEIRFYYNNKKKMCKLFAYGGCMGNANNFLSKEDCERVCKPDA